MTIEQLFWQLGVHMGTVGCVRAMATVKCVLENEDRLSRLILCVYMPVAQQLDCDWKLVERNLRTVILRAWKQNPDLMEQLAGYPLEKPPKAGEFLGMVYNYMARQSMKV